MVKRAAEEPLRPHHHLGRSTPNPNTHTPPHHPRSQPTAARVAPGLSSLPTDSTRCEGSPGPPACHRPPPHCLPAIRASLLNSAQLTPGVTVPGWWQDAGSLSGWTCLPAASLPPSCLLIFYSCSVPLFSLPLPPTLVPLHNEKLLCTIHSSNRSFRKLFCFVS